MAKKTLDVIFEAYLREQVEDAGGKWVGVQECEGSPADLVLFNSRLTGSTLAVKTDVDDIRDAVKRRIAKHDEEWRRIKNERPVGSGRS